MQVISFAGALMILVAYVGHQVKRMDASAALYNILNAAGSGILLYVALRPFQLGFVVLEGSWVAVSLWALANARRTRRQGEAAETTRLS